MALPATAETHQKNPTASNEAPSEPPPGERTFRFYKTSTTGNQYTVNTVVTDLPCPFQDRLGGLANQLTAALLACVLLAMIAFPASFRGTWKTALTKILFWLY